MSATVKRGRSRRAKNRDRAAATAPPAQAAPPAPPPGQWPYWVALNATVFIAAACIMTVEILSTRLVAPFLGASLYTWTSAIGVVLAGISLGNYLGGRLADRFHPQRTLSVLFIISSLTCVTIPLTNNWIGNWSALDGLSWPTRIFLHFTLAFLLPATMLGTMSPVVAKMALGLGWAVGRTIGTIYAWGAIGSIVGTFVAGFLLVTLIGTDGAILLVAGVLALMGLFYGYRSWIPYAWMGTCALALLVALGSWSATQSIASALGLRSVDSGMIVFKKDSQYQRVLVTIGMNPSERIMVLDSMQHSIVDLADPLNLKYEYEKIYAEIMRQIHPGNDPVSAFFVGGGGYVFPRYVELTYPGSYIEVAEIDPVVSQAALQTFGLPKDTSIHRFDMDARNRVSDLIRRKRAGGDVPEFDYVFGDAFNNFSVPYHLTTLEFNQQLSELMSEDGVYMLNVIDIYRSGRFLGAVFETCRKVFSNVTIFSTTDSNGRDAFVVVASKKPVDLTLVPDLIREHHEFEGVTLTPAKLAHLEYVNDGLLLTDDFAPVENLLAAVVQEQDRPVLDSHFDELVALVRAGRFEELIALSREILEQDPNTPRAHFRIATALAKLGKTDAALAEYRAELRVNPSHTTSYARIAQIMEARGDLEAAVGAYRAALTIDKTTPKLRIDLAGLLFRHGRNDEAEELYRDVIRTWPGYVWAHIGLGNLLLDKGEIESSAASFKAALMLAPDYPGVRENLGMTLLRAGHPEEAREYLRQAVDRGVEDARVYNLLGSSLVALKDFSNAVDAFSGAVDLEPSNTIYRANLGLALEKTGRHQDAVHQYRICLEHNDRNPPVMIALANLLATSPDDEARDGVEALRWAERLYELGPDRPEVLDTLAAAYAESGRFSEAVDAADRAERAAQKGGLKVLAGEIQQRLVLYEAGRPYRRGR
jgi:tetratricopeptide (TPR) repeat protein/spermidine synthase